MVAPTDFRSALKSMVLVGDGATGTQLQAAGLEPGTCGELWNFRYPERVVALHRSYIEAGADCVSTNTFGGTRLALARHGLANEIEAVNRSAAQAAREAWGDRPGFVLGDVGPFGGLLEPYGTVSVAEARTAFLEQIALLVQAGVDGILIETMTSIEELEQAVLAARDAGAPCILATMAFDAVRDGADFRTMMGVSPEQAAEALQGWGVDAAGCNCGAEVDPSRSLEIVRRFRKACDLPLIAQPNAGTPQLQGTRIIYRHDPESVAREVIQLVDAGTRLIGACCGSGPEHITAIRRQVSLVD